MIADLRSADATLARNRLRGSVAKLPITRLLARVAESPFWRDKFPFVRDPPEAADLGRPYVLVGGRADPLHHAVARRPRYSIFRASGRSAPQVRKASLSPIPHGILPPCDAGDDGARVGYDDLKFIPPIVDHEETVSR